MAAESRHSQPISLTEGVKNITATYNPGSGFATSSGTLSQTVDNHSHYREYQHVLQPGIE